MAHHVLAIVQQHAVFLIAPRSHASTTDLHIQSQRLGRPEQRNAIRAWRIPALSQHSDVTQRVYDTALKVFKNLFALLCGRFCSHNGCFYTRVAQIHAHLVRVSYSDTEEHAAQSAFAVRFVDPITDNRQHGLIFHGKVLDVRLTVVATFELHPGCRRIDHGFRRNLIRRQSAQIPRFD